MINCQQLLAVLKHEVKFMVMDEVNGTDYLTYSQSSFTSTGFICYCN